MPSKFSLNVALDVLLPDGGRACTCDESEEDCCREYSGTLDALDAPFECDALLGCLFVPEEECAVVSEVEVECVVVSEEGGGRDMSLSYELCIAANMQLVSQSLFLSGWYFKAYRLYAFLTSYNLEQLRWHYSYIFAYILCENIPYEPLMLSMDSYAKSWHFYLYYP